MRFSQINSPEEFISTKFSVIDKDLNRETSNGWQVEGEKESLKLFHQVAREVSGYRKFLKSNTINPDKIKSFSDLKNVPPTDKKNYIDRYPLEEIAWPGELFQSPVINSSSGTTGLPYFWPTSETSIVEGAIIKELVYRRNFAIENYKTVVVVCFGMGTWIAGAFTILTTQLVGRKGYNLTTVSPGFNKEETLRILDTLALKFEQIVIAGLPTFVKDLLESFKVRKYAKKLRIRLLLAGEGFSEDWRDYILKLLGSKRVYFDVVSIFGSADASLMGFETPESIYLRRLAVANERVRRSIFNDERVAALVNYIPSHRFFETVGGELLLSANQGIPLVRYNIHDFGGIFAFDQVYKYLKDFPFLGKNKLPFVYIFGRGKFTATIYAANIYPENVRDVLTDISIQKFVTGRFTQETIYNNDQSHYLNINVELSGTNLPAFDLGERIARLFVAKVRKVNSEYGRVYQEYGDKVKPRVVLHRQGTSALFPADKIKKYS